MADEELKRLLRDIKVILEKVDQAMGLLRIDIAHSKREGLKSVSRKLDAIETRQGHIETRFTRIESDLGIE